MKPIKAYAFNMDSACVELRFLDGTMPAIDTIAVEDEIAQKGHTNRRIEDYPFFSKLIPYLHV